MNRRNLLISIAVLSAWLYVLFIGLRTIDPPAWLNGIALPKTMAELGDSLGIVNGLMSTLAVVLAFATLAEQRKSAERSKLDQDRAYKLMAQQLTYQFQSMRQSYLRSEEIRLQGILERIDGDHRKAELWDNVVKRKKRVLRELNLIEQRLTPTN